MYLFLSWIAFIFFFPIVGIVFFPFLTYWLFLVWLIIPATWMFWSTPSETNTTPQVPKTRSYGKLRFV